MPDLAAPSRKDAARNRVLLLQAAERLFARSIDVSLKDVAREANVGVGTAYRHFPTRDDLINALGAERLGEALSLARAAASEPDGWEGLVRFLEDSMAMHARNGCLRGLVAPGACSSPMVAETREAIAALVQLILTRAHEQGTLRSGTDAADVQLIQVGLLAVVDATRETDLDRYRHHLRTILDGLRAPSPRKSQSKY